MSPDAWQDLSSERFEFPIERGKILEFARAIHSDNPSFCGPNAIAPPTFLAVAAAVWGYSWEVPGDSPLAEVGFDASKGLQLEEDYEYFGPPPSAGTVLTGQITLSEPVSKVGRRSGPMTILSTETTFWDEEGRVVAKARQVVARLDAAHEKSTDGNRTQ